MNGWHRTEVMLPDPGVRVLVYDKKEDHKEIALLTKLRPGEYRWLNDAHNKSIMPDFWRYLPSNP